MVQATSPPNKNSKAGRDLGGQNPRVAEASKPAHKERDKDLQEQVHQLVELTILLMSKPLFGQGMNNARFQ